MDFYQSEDVDQSELTALMSADLHPLTLFSHCAEYCTTLTTPSR